MRWVSHLRGQSSRPVRARPFPERASACWHPDLWRAVERRLASAHYDLVHLFGGIQVYELRNLIRGFPNLIAPYESHTLFLTREVASLRLAIREQATRDFVRSELRDLLGELEERALIRPVEQTRTSPRHHTD